MGRNAGPSVISTGFPRPDPGNGFRAAERRDRRLPEPRRDDSGVSMKKAALNTAGTIFALVSIAHWVRYFRDDELVIGGYTVPVGLSLLAGAIILALSVWMFVAARD